MDSWSCVLFIDTYCAWSVVTILLFLLPPPPPLVKLEKWIQKCISVYIHTYPSDHDNDHSSYKYVGI